LVLRVFVASPDDVEDERAALGEAVDELNEGKFGIRLELVRWEKDCCPGIGSDPQSVINEQIADYDIFVGIMWKKFGSPTPRASLGTAEEFERAYNKYKQDPTSLRIMLYFKDAPPASMSEIDPSQWSLVNQFRERLGEQGTLYWTYKDSNGFKTLARLHLGKQIHEWGKSWGIQGKPIQPLDLDESKICNSTDTEDETEEGFLDLIELGLNNINNLLEITDRINRAINAIGNKVSERATELASANTPRGFNLKVAKRAADDLADDMESFVARMNIEVPLFAESFSKGVDAWGRAAVLSTDFDKTDKQLTKTKEELIILQKALTDAQGGIIKFRQAVSASPRLTKTFNRAKKHTVDILDLLISEMKNASNLSSEVEKVVAEAIENMRPK